MGIGAVGLIASLILPEGIVRTAIALIAWLVVGWPTITGALRGLIRGRMFDENLLMFIATVGAFLLGECAEAVAVMLFFAVGEWVQGRAEARSRRSITELMELRPEEALLYETGAVRSVDPAGVCVGDCILVRPGDRVPLDGVIIEGSSSLDTAALTGESVPRDVFVGSEIHSGCVNLSGQLIVRVTRPYADSTVQKILELVESAAGRKARTDRFITRFARYYTPAVVAAAVLIALLPSLITGDWNLWVHRALMLLVVSCPCALVLSVPLTYFSGIGGASRRGILIKGANYMDALANTKTVAFDKTGTLTRGELTLSEIVPHGVSKEQLLELAAIIESASDHPLAAAVLRAYGKEPAISRLHGAHAIPGQGMAGFIDGHPILAGNARLLDDIALPETAGTVIHLALDGSYIGTLHFSDTLKPEAAEALADLKALGVSRTVLLTGDDAAAAAECAHALGISEVHAGLLPAGKVSHVEALVNNHDGSVLFVGDGINDAPVLARADVGIAMGGFGSDAAIEAADVVLMRDDPRGVAEAIAIARRTNGIVAQNIALSLIVKLGVMLLVILGAANMWEAVFADVGVAVCAILNASRAAKTGRSE